ncbi:MAG: M23 family metallopeptidase [Candidatus Cloacimonetes bacterium]|nr:M23 family metallopeptidase [Candidatus Cloacimonadota bacterium]MDY0229219.1 M23 family metallopeptidase [Candidatus Cloacimonadaceae bacterium]
MNMGKQILLTLVLLTLITFSLSSLFHLQGKEDEAKSEALAPIPDPWITQTIPAGGSIFSVLANLDLPGTEIGMVSWRFGDFIDVTTIQPGDTLRVILNETGDKISKMMFVQEPTIRHLFEARGDSLAYTKEALPVQLRTRILDGTLVTTLDAALLALGLSPMDKQNINNGLEGDIDFQRDARKGDSFRVFIEERIFEGKPLPRAKILYVNYEGVRTGFHELFRYAQDDENSVLNGLYNKEGKSNNSSGVGYPLASIHVSSSFGKRLDPFTGRWANHQGVDYRAAYGTPVYAVAAGTVSSARYNGGYGKEVRIKHPSGMMTLYAHLQNFSVRAGQSVKRGQIIGRVGSTGRSTGAHLHFGLHSGGSFINPSQLRMVGAEKLNKKQMQEFELQKEMIRNQMQNKLSPQVAKS